MSERPILFSAPMVLALLAGTKTQTRRILKAGAGKQAKWLTPELLAKVRGVTVHPRGIADCGPGVQLDHPGGGPLGYVTSPYGGVGDRLWVKETWGYRGRGVNFGVASDNGKTTDISIEYAADKVRRTIIRPSEGIDEQLPKTHCLPKFRGMGAQHPVEEHYAECLTAYWQQWRPSIFMRQWMSRLTLEVTGVRVERLQEISEADAQAEGVDRDPSPVEPDEDPREVGYPSASDVARWEETKHRRWFRSLWESINGPGSWAANPWVWRIEFKKASKS